ncbi:MAG: TIGR03619 family F420-dependent LLM class oxidoreductase [Propionibacteriales bacterium]|nr:TIGR03619 family F420-dependent LLM class oxidoreductase [Propionibacteriales bacterium]
MTVVGLSVPQIGAHVTADVVEGFVRRAEELGYGSLWVQERLLRPLHPRSKYAGVSDEIPADYACALGPTELLAAVAAWTSTVRLGTSVLVAGYHRPVELAKRLATIDVLSGGRLTVGLGIGWSAEEHEVCEVDPSTRGARCDDFIPALLACWGPDPVQHTGPFFTIPEAQIGPKPVQDPRPPLIFGMPSRPGLRRTARWADGWNPAGGRLDTILETKARLDAARPDGAAQLTVHRRLFLQPPVPTLRPRTVEAMAEEVAASSRAGVDEVIVELSLWEELRSGDDWLAAPDRLLPVLEAAG